MSGYHPPQPLCRSFNVAVLAMAMKVCPMGYDVGSDAPSTLAGLNDHIERTGRILVWDGASDNTIFDSPEVNYAFRAWYDWCHWAVQADFTEVGEYSVYMMQLGHLYKFFGGHPEHKLWRSLLYVEVVEQNKHQRQTGDYPDNQMAFVKQRLAELRVTTPFAA